MSRSKRDNKRTVLAVAAHPDDEVLGCGGTLARHAANGDAVHVLILAEGWTSRDVRRNVGARKNELAQLADAARRSCRILRCDSIALHNFPDNRMDSVNLLDVVKIIEAHCQKHKPDILYTHHAGDLNIDHQIVHQAVVTSARPQPNQSIKRILFFEVPSSTNYQTPGSAPSFTPHWYADISTTLPQKLAALKCYHTEMRPWPHSRSYRAIEALARWRGASAGCAAAEAFMLGRELT